MRVCTFVVALLALAVTAAGCSSVDPRGERAQAAPTATPQKAAESEQAEEPQATRFRGAQAGAYRNALRICSVFTVRETARYYGVEARARPAAEAHAVELYGTGQLRKAAFQGCLDGFRAQRR